MINTQKKNYTLICRYPEINYMLLIRPNTYYSPYVAAWDYNSKSEEWSQGHYFDSLSEAINYIIQIHIERGVPFIEISINN